jgi:hypothetical protein
MLSVPLFRGPVLYFFQYRAALRQMRNEEKELSGNDWPGGKDCVIF